MDLGHLVVLLYLQICLLLQLVNGMRLRDLRTNCPSGYPYMFKGKCVKKCPPESHLSHESCILHRNVENRIHKVHKRDTWPYCESDSVHCISPMICQEGRCVCPYYALIINGSCRNTTSCPNYIPYIEITSQGRQCTDRCHDKDVLYRDKGLCLPFCDYSTFPPQSVKDANNITICSRQCPMYYYRHCPTGYYNCSYECVSSLPLIFAFILCLIAVVILSVTLWIVAFNGRRNIHSCCRVCSTLAQKRKRDIRRYEDQDALIDQVI